MRKIKGLRWYMIALVTLGTVLGYLTRNTVAAAAPTLMEELNISTQQYSYIIAAYSAAYTVMQPVAGYVLDVLGTKIGYAMFAVLWAVFCGATALAGSWGGLAIARGAVGAAEAAMIPAGGMGNRNAQLADGIYHLRCIELYLGDGMADFL